MQNQTVLIMAGGTGGHVFPALAVAKEFLSRNISVVWLGTHQGIEAQVIPEAGIPIEWVSVSGLRGKGLVRLIKAPFMMALATWQCFRILMRVKPRVVLGMGGFVTGPGGVVAKLMARPLCIHEQNAIAGMTNRYLSRLANKVMQAFPTGFPANVNALVTGNPVREKITALPAPELRMRGREGVIRLLVLGGSLGAQALNEIIPQALSHFPESERPLVKHQTGKKNYEQAVECYQQAGIKQGVEILSFIEDMADVYAWADFVICRAGALTVSELSAAGLGSLLVPYPYAVDDHQTKNAQFLVDAGAGYLVSQKDLNVDHLYSLLQSLNKDRNKLVSMAQSARRLAQADAANRVADQCCEAGGLI
ncbi:MAG: undecaprenyldiphospho-muramoylpentapeptide beta-N-acetylglucosaminyltransferase [Gammaproteobacteria bacterium]|nr:undecaprenyldiphospho-muramoylpentapeptide beta-N-acetylglucosaminyltransferase [Gammaproteobacteria bacterium]